LLEEELKQLHSRGYIETASLPDLGPIPQSSPVSAHSDSPEASSDESESDSNSEDEEEEEEEEEEDAGAAGDDDGDEYAEKSAKKDSTGRATRPRTRRSTTTKAVSESASTDDKKARPSDDALKPETEVPKKRKRGRPPKIDTPEEARIRTILRAIRKVKDSDGRQLFLAFEKLPDPDQYPDYYNEIKRPIALDNITVMPFWNAIKCRKK
jgi:chromatin structure-remodeling complex subunit RSC1/2